MSWHFNTLLCICSFIGVPLMALQIESPAFEEGDTIPVRYTCDGQDLSPPLFWKGEPANTKSFVLICDDPDAPVGIWDHWLLFNMPTDTKELHEGLFNRETLPNGAIQGRNSWGKVGYNGPCPPKGSNHRYFFSLYALDTMLSLPATATKAEIQAAMKGHILAESKLMGHYARK